MEYLLSKNNVSLLESFCLAKTLFAFDYDGTLAPICGKPEAAFMKPSLAKMLVELSDIASVAILTGRSIASVESFLPVQPKYLIGNHGAEGIQTASELEAMKLQCRSWVSELNQALSILGKLGVTIEDKTYSLSLHFRNSDDPEVAETALLLITERLKDCRVTKGKFVLNLLPMISLDKGKALDRIIKTNGYHFGVYFGDDQTDEDVFKHHSSRLLTVKIGTESSQARYFLERQEEMEEVLKMIVGFIAKSRSPVNEF